MTNRKFIQTLLLAVLVGSFSFSSASADTLLEYFDFENDSAGSAFGANWTNSGINGSEWNFGGPGTITTDGAGDLVISGQAGSVFRKLPKNGTLNAAAGADQYANPYSSGKFRLNIDFASWNLDGTGIVNNQIDLQLRPTASSGSLAGVKLKLQDSTTARVQLYYDSTAAGNQNSFRNFDFALSETTAQSFAIEFDYSNSMVEYFHNGVATHSFSDLNTATSLGTLQFATNANWLATNTVAIEEFGLTSVETVPEPTSLALLGLVTVGMATRRRRS